MIYTSWDFRSHSVFPLKPTIVPREARLHPGSIEIFCRRRRRRRRQW